MLLPPASLLSKCLYILRNSHTDDSSTYFEVNKRTTTETETLKATFLNPSPKCTIAPSICTSLWESYLKEEGMPTAFDNATEPAITSMPTQRPRCAVGNVTAICDPIPQPSCIISARKVDLYVSPLVYADSSRNIRLTARSTGPWSRQPQTLLLHCQAPVRLRHR